MATEKVQEWFYRSFFSVHDLWTGSLCC